MKRTPSVVAVVALLLSALGSAPAAAQGAVISGKVMSDFGQPVEGANVYINDLAISLSTNPDGNYTINIAPARISGQLVNLRVRAVGYQPQTRPIRITAGAQTIDFTMKRDVNRLDEIVVTGVVEGTERSKVPFAVARLTSADMPVPALDPMRALAGKVPGVRIAQTNGMAGSTPEVMMRGPTSINADGRGQGPLIIVDGAIMNIGNMEELGGLDIESVEIVKGAAGASLYGTRAANGVITIKTRRGGVQEGVRFGARTEYGFSDLNSIDYGMPVNHHLQLDETGKRFCIGYSSGTVANCSQTIDWMTEIMRINNVAGDTVRQPQNVQWNAATSSGGMLQNTYQSNIWPGQHYNALAQMLAKNPVVLQQIDATGKMAGVRFYVSGSYQDERGALRGLEGSQQRRGRVNVDYDVRNDITISVSSLFDHGTRDLRAGGSSNGGLFGQLLRGAPAGTDYMAVDTLGRPIVLGGGAGLRGSTNGQGTLQYNTWNDQLFNKRSSDRFLGNVAATYFPTQWATVEAVFAYDTRDRRDDVHAVKGYRTIAVSSALNDGQISINNRKDESYNGSLMATLRRNFSTDLSGKLSFRALFDEQTTLADNAQAQVFLVKDIHTLDNATDNFDANSSSSVVRNTGYLAGGTLEYKDRYIFDGTFRYDGSSLFGQDNRWAPFGRVSMVWRVSQEEFWNVPYVTDFRLRGSRGTAGSTPRFDAQYETYNIQSGALSLGQAGNRDLRPETTTEYEFGSDLTLFGRLGVEVTHARAKTRDQILQVNTPASFGFATQWQNAGSLTNRTWELGLNLPVMNSKTVQWSMRATWDRTRTFVEDLMVPEFLFNGGTAQGSGGFFRITDSTQYRLPDGTSLTNGFQANRYGNIWGRKFLKQCSQLRSPALRAQCGPGLEYQVNDQGYLVWVGSGNSWTEGITKNLWQTILPGTRSPFGDAVPLYWGMPIVDRPLRGEPNEGIGINQVLGNVFPDFRFTFSNNVQYKRLSAFALFDATIGHDIFNQGEQWGLFDFNSASFDNANRTVENAKPVGYGWRTGPSEAAGIGGFYDVLGPNNYSVEDGSFAKLREVTLSYRVGPLNGVGDWSVGLVGRNLLTFTGYSGYDPETGVGAGSTGSGLINQIDAFGFPTLRTFTLSLSSRF